MNVGINHEQRLYVIYHGRYVACLGFDAAFRQAEAVAKWTACAAPEPEKVGTKGGYEEYRRIMDKGAGHANRTGQRCPAELTQQLRGLEGRRVEVVDAYGERRRFWVGRSTGWLPVHLEIARRDSSGGPAVTGAPFRSLRMVNTERR